MMRRTLQRWSTVAVVMLLAACSSTDKRSPADLTAIANPISVAEGWSTKLGAVEFALQPATVGSQLALASSDGTVAVVDALSGRDVWRSSAAGRITAGVGFDGQTAAVINAANEVVAIRNGEVLWKQRLSGRGYTPPLVAGGRIFALAADRTVSAYDADTGRRLWLSSKASNEALVLQNAGVLMAVGDTLVAGVSGRLLGINPVNGATAWNVTVGFVRGGNDMERLIDVIGPASRTGASVCLRAFQLATACVDVQRRTLAWANPGKGITGLGGDASAVYSTESDGKLHALRRTDGSKIWTNDKLAYRELSAPASNGRFVVLGDGMGVVHWVDRATGETIGRAQADKSPIVAQPLLVGNQAIVVSKSGAVTSYLVQ